MQLLQKLFKKEKQIENQSEAAASTLQSILSRNNTSTAALENTRWFGVCLTKNAETIAETQFVLRSKEDPEKIIEDHEIIDRFNMPNTGEDNNNRSLNFSKLLYLMYQSYIITGNVYIEKLIDGQWNFLDATKVKPEYDQEGTEILYYRVTTPKGPRPIATQNMFHYETPEKIAYIEKIADLLNINKVLFDFTQTFYANGGFIGDVFETENTTEEQLRKLTAKFESSHKGTDTVNKVLFLPRGITLVPRNSGNGNRVSHEEKMANREDIFAAMGTPLSIVGITKSGSSRADSESKERTYKLNMAKPWVDGTFAFFNERIVKEYDETRNLYLEPIITYPKDTEANRADAIAMLGGNGTDPFGTYNEARERMSLPPREGMDIIPTQEQGEAIAGMIKNNKITIPSALDKMTMAIMNQRKKRNDIKKRVEV